MAILTCRMGVHQVENIEDAVQSALMTALETWPHAGSPDNPSAWLYRVARNHLMETLRQHANRRRLLDQHFPADIPPESPDQTAFLPNEIRDDMLRMLFLCCEDSIPLESQLVIALKLLCGFDVREIGIRLFTSEANVYKRLTRARKRMRDLPLRSMELNSEQYTARLPALRKVLYLLFTEGHLSSHTDVAIRRELCQEALRLTGILAGHPVGQTAETDALLALMHFHIARLNAREQSPGALLLLEEQDRALWDRQEILKGLEYLGKSAQGEMFSRYHAEAGIAAEHCMATSFETTRWDKIVENYELLEKMAPSPLHRLNRAMAVAEWKGPEAGLRLLDAFEPPSWLAASYMWWAVLADLHRRCVHPKEAAHYSDIAIETAPTEAIRVLLTRRLKHPGPE